ncbi:DUF2092 domain-containing protein [Variovorax soli]|uniref:DUF2092 domain-containing protein n=1 Tax=Variovorax soli TaxID=376815 RepID=UPI000839548D|nr:DUF2092 domain-containing protein [Variovorax soli]
MTITTRRHRLFWICASFLALSLGMQQVGAQPAGVDPAATALLRRSMDYLGGLQRFSVESDNTLEVVLISGQKLEFDSAARTTVRRPDRLRAERMDESQRQVLYYDGAALTVSMPGTRHYATVAAPASLDATLDFAREQLNLIAPASDLLASNAYERLTQDLQAAFIVGPSVIAGEKATQVAFRAPDVDFQLWVKDGPSPLPLKYVITTKSVAGMPGFAVTLRKWNLDPKVPDTLFRYVPSAKSQRVDVLATTPAVAAPTK